LDSLGDNQVCHQLAWIEIKRWNTPWWRSLSYRSKRKRIWTSLQSI
jgi:hypothetical protein